MTGQMDENTNGYKILLVEDQKPDTLIAKRRILDVWPDAQIIAADSLSQAYEILKTNVFNLVLLDLDLPEAYGAGTVKEIRSFNAMVPIVVLTGMDDDVTTTQAIKLGANHVAKKSQILSAEFENILKKHIQKIS